MSNTAKPAGTDPGRSLKRSKPSTSPTYQNTRFHFENVAKYPKFLVVQANNGKALDKISPFIIAKTIQAVVGCQIAKATPLRSGTILLETFSKEQSDSLMQVKDFAGIPVIISPHNTLNSSKGVIRCQSLQHMNDEEILEGLAEQGITGIRRITSTRNGIQVPTRLIILTFDTPKPPQSIKVGYEVVEVEQYIPNPLRCTRCQRYGHHHTRCDSRKPITCSVCGDKDHTSTPESPCKATPKCANCAGPHPAYSRECPYYVKEKQILRIKVEQNLSIPEARRKVNNTPSWNMTTTFAQAASATRPKTTLTKTVSTQCDDLLPGTPPLILWKASPNPNSHINQASVESATSTLQPPSVTRPQQSTLEDRNKLRNKQQSMTERNPAVTNPNTHTLSGRRNNAKISKPSDLETIRAIQSILPESPPSFVSPNQFDALSMETSDSTQNESYGELLQDERSGLPNIHY
jgi:hypothetical protein